VPSAALLGQLARVVDELGRLRPDAAERGDGLLRGADPDGADDECLLALLHLPFLARVQQTYVRDVSLDHQAVLPLVDPAQLDGVRLDPRHGALDGCRDGLDGLLVDDLDRGDEAETLGVEVALAGLPDDGGVAIDAAAGFETGHYNQLLLTCRVCRT